MSTAPPFAHAVTARVAVTADDAYAFLADPVALGRWSLGCMDLVADGPGVWRGRSLFDGGEGWLSIDGDPARRLVDFHVGTRDLRVPRISARVVAGPVCGLDAATSYVTLTAWRAQSMSDERWQRLCATHEAEIWLIKAQMETRAAARSR